MNQDNFPKTRVTLAAINNLIQRLNFGLIKPFPALNQRRDLIVTGLKALAEECGANIVVEPLGKAAGNDILITCVPVGDEKTAHFGETLAEYLNTIPVFHNAGEMGKKGYVNDYNSFLYMKQHFAEQLLFNAIDINDKAKAA
jgi:hypothetical protein